ncbi:1956_t:CDS:1 [Funneliformis mosseae]|uniref:1956_t:CDS:1 n=1 Tax=Funneliformis mosseae TaxID=27381 RepID=A0A9N9HKK8_FUNMO|nr:1956_t:CDS:1 [Funneliformis mosseae]
MYQNPTENYEKHENIVFTPRDNNPSVTAAIATSNDERYPTTSFANKSSHNQQFTSHISNEQQILEQNPPSTYSPHNNPPIHSPSMNNASPSQIQTVEILGYEIIIIPTSSSLASLTSLGVQHQLQQDNAYLDHSVNPPQLNQERNYTFATNEYDPTLQYPSHAPQSPQIQTVEIPGYKIFIIPTSSPLASSTNFDMQRQLQQGNTYFDYSSFSVNSPQLNQQHYFSSAYETSISENVVNAHNHVSDNTQPQQNYLGLNESLNSFQQL